MDAINSIWTGVNLDEPVCHRCNKPITPSSVLVRTFILRSQERNDLTSQPCTQEIKVPSLSETIQTYHRHLDCLHDDTTYIAVSHVWNPLVANLVSALDPNLDPDLIPDLERRRAEAIASVGEVTKIVHEEPVRTFRGLAAELDEKFELWHDYLSVPQWEPAWKLKIIDAIPKIFHEAHFTLIHQPDLPIASIAAMRNGSTPYEKCRGMSDICNAKYFSRVWTAMEFAQSRNTRVMVETMSSFHTTLAITRLWPN
jgi:hypothetical protein